MKYFTTAGCLLVSALLFAQEQPLGFSMHQSDIAALEVMEVSSFVQEELMAEAEQNDKLGRMSLYGKISPVATDPATSGTWTILDDGSRVWQLRFRSAGAKSVDVFFDDFHLPEGASLFLYTADMSWYVGPYTSEENEAHGRFRTGETFGEEAILEYYEPAGVIGTPRLHVRGFGHYFRFVQDVRDDRGASEDCEVDVNCPEGDAWENEKRSIVRLSIPAGNGVGLCTGSLVNNTSMDCKNYILTAYHCTIDSNDADLLDVAVRFNYQRPNCGSGNAPSTNQKIGTFHRADSNDGGGASGSDFALLEMEDDIPESYVPYYSGWDATGVTPTTGADGYKATCLHHPAGDVKKISKSNSVVSGTWGAPNHHWRVEWMATQTNWGVTEGGSSGSPIYDKNHRIIGTLTGGGSFCTSPTADDYYGKMDRHWDGNPNPSNEDLEDWLDPGNTGIEVMDGSFVGPSLSQPCGMVGVEEGLLFHDVQLFPTVANDHITVSTDRYNEIREVRIFDATGALVRTERLEGSTTQFGTLDLSSGMYYITFLHTNGSHLTRKFTVVH